MIVLPCAAAAVMWIGYLKARYQLRSQVPRHLKAGRKHFAQRDFDAALREYNQAITPHPNWPRPIAAAAWSTTRWARRRRP